MPKEVYSQSPLTPIFPEMNVGERYVNVGSGLHLVGDRVVFFPAFVKLRNIFIEGVLRGFSYEDALCLQTYYNIPVVIPKKEEPSLLDKSKKLLPFLPGKIADAVIISEEKIYEVKSILDDCYCNTALLQEVINCNIIRFLDTKERKNSEKDRADDCLYQLLALYKEMKPGAYRHEMQGADPNLVKDYLCLLICYACREQSMSSFQVLYLEKLVFSLGLDSKWFCDTFFRCLQYDEQTRKDILMNLVDKQSVRERVAVETLVADLLLVDGLRLSYLLGKDKLQLPSYLLKDREKLFEMETKVREKIQELDL